MAGDFRAARDPNEISVVGVESSGSNLAVSYIRLPPSKLFIPRGSEKAKPHVYQPLPEGRARFLRRVPQSNHDELIFDFISLPISSPEAEGKYTAISYCWGDSPADQALVLKDGSTIPVTARMIYILQEIIHRARCNVIWVDAICINQQDPIEKSGQISLMTDIYHHAESVEIWLDAGVPSRRAMNESLHARAASPNATYRAGILRPEDSYSAFPPYTNHEIIELMWSPWFERAWVVQEYCYSKRRNFHYRGILINFLFLKRVYDWGNDLAFGRMEDEGGSRCEVLIPPMIRHLAALVSRHVNTAMRAVHRNPLEDILGQFYHCKATNPHDKVIAFIGMASGEWPKNFTIDYGRHPAVFYLDVMVAMMRQSTDFALFGFAGITSRRPLFDDIPGVPSWLPDLTSPPPHSAWSWQWWKFNASGIRKEGGVRPDFVIPKTQESRESYNSFMLTPGVYIDTVVGFLSGCERRNFAYLPSFLTVAAAVSHVVSPYPTGEPPRDVLRKTLIAADSDCLSRDCAGADFDQICKWVKADDLELDKIWALEGRYYQTMLVEGAGGTRGLFWTKNGYIGLTANGVNVGDEIWLFRGARVPFVLRGPATPYTSGKKLQQCYKLVAEAYVHGAMNGELANVKELEWVALV